MTSKRKCPASQHTQSLSLPAALCSRCPPLSHPSATRVIVLAIAGCRPQGLVAPPWAVRPGGAYDPPPRVGAVVAGGAHSVGAGGALWTKVPDHKEGTCGTSTRELSRRVGRGEVSRKIPPDRSPGTQGQIVCPGTSVCRPLPCCSPLRSELGGAARWEAVVRGQPRTHRQRSG